MTPVAGRKQALADGARYFQKSPGLLCQRVEVRDAFIVQHQETWPLAVWCEVLEVSRGGVYAYAQRQVAPRMDRDEVVLLARVKAIHAETGHRYGSRRMATPLQAEGDAVGRDNARRLMPQAVGAVRRRKRGPVTTDRRHGDAVAPNLWARQFDVAQPNTVWVGDITYVWTAEGGESLAVLLDLHSRKVVGWAMQSRMDAALVQAAVGMALGRRRPSAGLIHHADRGSQYACHAYQTLLAENGICCSMSRTGECLDNAVAERFFGSVNGERTALRHDATRQEARNDVIEYIEMFYNSKRLHSYVGYVSPRDFERLAGVASLSVRFYLTITHRSDLELSGAPDAQMRAIGFSKYQWVSTERASKDNLPQNRA